MAKIIRAATVGTSLYSFCKGFLRELKAEGYEVVALSSVDEDFLLLAESDGVRTIGVSMERHISPIKDLRSLYNIYKVFRSEKPDMVHSMTPKAGLLCMIASWMARVPVRVHTFTGLVWPTATGVSRQILKMTDRITCWCATDIIPEGEGVKNDLINGRITRKQLKVLGYGNVRGTDLDYYKRSGERSASHSPLTFIFVGRLVGDKGVNELVKAFAKLYETNKDLRLLLVGHKEQNLDPLAEETMRLIDDCPGIEAVGNQADVRPWMEQSDVLVLPSYREGFPNVVLEAGAMELPCIVTDINGAREIVLVQRNDIVSPRSDMKICENGIVIPSKSTDALAAAMQWMVGHPEVREQMAAVARPWVEARWEQSFVRKCLKDFYAEKLR